MEGGGGFLEMGVGPSLSDDIMYVKAPNTGGVHSTSISFSKKVFQHIDMTWLGISVRP